MPKKKVIETRAGSRRQASKEALKQMQLLLDDEEEDAFAIPSEDDEVIPVVETPPKKKYKLSHRKSSDGNDRDVIVLKSISNHVSKESTLELECNTEELSDVQKRRKEQYDKEDKELQSKLAELAKAVNAEVVFKGDLNSTYEINEFVTKANKPYVQPNIVSNNDAANSYHLVMDPRLGIIVGTVQKNNQQSTPPSSQKTYQPKLQIASAVKAAATIPQNHTPTRQMRTRRSGGLQSPATPPPIQTRTANQKASTSQTKTVNQQPKTPLQSSQTRNASISPQTRTVATRSLTPTGKVTAPTKVTPVSKPTPPSKKTPIVSNTSTETSKTKGVVDLTSDDRSQADSREISFNKLQGKTYPSLVVVARPHLRVTDLATDRAKLDAKVKSVLMHPPTKFTEWLIQQGLVRSEQKCPVHSSTQLKLGMYSDASKFPFSGGYVWISECCPQRFISVFNGSLFEGSPNPPMVMLKLIYHWSCQTNIQNVTQWVKVDNLYVKGVFTWLRAICTVAVHSHIRQLGGPNCRIEVGVISLGTTSHDGNQRQVKVEVLGILETNSKFVRLRAVEPMADGDRNFKKKFSKILEPILQWVHPASIIVTDLTVDKSTLHTMGFMNVVQTTSNEYTNSNRTIMEYLRRIVPRMFQNTLSLLSRQIIQQFLDELVWREWFGITAAQSFDNIVSHLAEQTRSNTQQSLILRLNKVAANPFKHWSLLGSSGGGSGNTASTPVPVVANISQTPAQVPSPKPVLETKRFSRNRKTNSPQIPPVLQDVTRPVKPTSPDVPEQMVPLENYYYGTIEATDPQNFKVTLNMKCPFCKSTFDNNLQLQNHLFKHAHNVSNDAYLCRYCLTSVSTANELLFHVNISHPSETKFDNGFVCLICETHYMNPFVLGKHMSKEHSPHELPYECGSCSFRCSNHKQIIDHFYSNHNGGTAIQCPFCLKSTTVWSGGRNITQNMHYFIQHLQKHQRKQLAKRCGKCNLWFVQKDILKEHQTKMHVSLRGRLGLVPWPAPRNGVMVPKSKIDKHPCDAEVINFSSLYHDIPSQSKCRECELVIDSSKHFPSFDSCQNPNCQYSTCCANAMMTHNAKCKGLNSVIPEQQLPYEMFCVCGHKDTDGNSMAKHLAICEKKSAYPSQTSAKSATVTHSMLDVLGLVRKPEESSDSVKSTVEKHDTRKHKTLKKILDGPDEENTTEKEMEVSDIAEESTVEKIPDRTDVVDSSSKKDEETEEVMEIQDVSAEVADKELTEVNEEIEVNKLDSKINESDNLDKGNEIVEDELERQLAEMEKDTTAEVLPASDVLDSKEIEEIECTNEESSKANSEETDENDKLEETEEIDKLEDTNENDELEDPDDNDKLEETEEIDKLEETEEIDKLEDTNENDKLEDPDQNDKLEDPNENDKSEEMDANDKSEEVANGDVTKISKEAELSSSINEELDVPRDDTENLIDVRFQSNTETDEFRTKTEPEEVENKSIVKVIESQDKEIVVEDAEIEKTEDKELNETSVDIPNDLVISEFSKNVETLSNPENLHEAALIDMLGSTGGNAISRMDVDLPNDISEVAQVETPMETD